MRGDGAQCRDFTFVDDVVDANIRAMDADLEPGTVMNIGTGIKAPKRGKPLPQALSADDAVRLVTARGIPWKATLVAYCA